MTYGRGAPNKRTTVQLTTLQLEEAGDRERHTTEERESAAKNVVRLSQKTARLQKRGEKNSTKEVSRVEGDRKKIYKRPGRTQKTYMSGRIPARRST